MLVEGLGVNAVTRVTGANKRTVLRLLADVGKLCADYHDLVVRNLAPSRLQVDEVWSYVGCKAKSKRAGKKGDGDCWTWVAIDADTRLCIAYSVGLRTAQFANAFIADLADRIVSDRVQITSGGLGDYVGAVRHGFGDVADFAQLQKIYRLAFEPERRYSPAVCVGCLRKIVIGEPDRDHISTSYVERQHLSVRMENRRMSRLTISFSKKSENHAHAIALHYFKYNFIRKHKTLGTTPAIAAGLTDKLWTVADLVELLEREERKLAKGGRINRVDQP